MSHKRTKLGNFIHSSWGNLNIRAGNGKYKKYSTKSKSKYYDNILICFSREEYKNFCTEQKEKILSLVRPSLDRLDAAKDYTLDNIQIVELSFNVAKEKSTINLLLNNATCTKCSKEMDLGLFQKSSRALTGYIPICKACERLRSKARVRRKCEK